MIKKALLLVLVSFTVHLHAQDAELSKWIDQIGKDMIDMNDLGKYSSKPVPEDVFVDLIMVDRYKIAAITDNTFTIDVDHGKGIFCSKITFQYIKKDNDYYLVFGKVTKGGALGKSMDPWVEKVTDCK